MKIWIVGPQGCKKRDIYRMLRDDKYSVGKLFTNLADNDITYNRYLYKTYPTQVINEMFENGQYVFITESKDKGTFTGLDFAEYDSHDVFVLTPEQFVSINAEQYFKDSLVVWLDGEYGWRMNNIIYDDTREDGDTTYNHTDVENWEKTSYRDMYKAMMSLADTQKNVIYFSQEDASRVKTIIKLYATNPRQRTEIVRGFTPIVK